VDSVLYLTDGQGSVKAVQIPVDMWRRLEPHARVLAGAPPEPEEPMGEFQEFLRLWDFRYSYDPAVSCPHCGAATEDWREGPDRPFRLTTASFGGLLVFRCQRCGATVRQKHFRDHVSHEHTPPGV
jgi:endogenous inhibitor of DNA gyrase (YacG/DUF329 family)